MKPFSLIVLFLILVLVALSAGCSGASGKADTRPAAVPATTSPPANITYQNHGISFVYPDNLALTERDASKDKTASWESGELDLRGQNGDHISVNWMAMHHKPPNIPVVYEAMRTSFQKDPKYSDVKYYLLETYPETTCGDVTLIGHMSRLDKSTKIITNEGILFWYHAKQDRTYYIDMASGNDYSTVVRESLGSYQQSFRCVDT
jgi:hypothetical protein